LLADLPREHASAAGRISPEHCFRVIATRIVIGASAVTAVSLAAVSAANALSTNSSSNGLDNSQKRELAREVLAHEGITLPRGFKFPPPPGFDWVGTITPAAIAVVLVGLIVVLCLARPGRCRTARKAR
jgi:hypothetical protein